MSPASSEPSGFNPVLKRALTEDESESGGNGNGSHDAKKVFRRSYKACINCRAKKIKCDLGDLSNPSDPPCARCRREGRKCEFSVSRRGGSGNSRAGKLKRPSVGLGSAGHGESDGNGGGNAKDASGKSGGRGRKSKDQHGLRDGAALSAGAVQAASGAQHDYSSNTTAAKNNGSGSNGAGPGGSESGSEEGSEENDIAGKELHNTSDALDILAHAARNYPKIESPSSQVPQPESSLQEKVFQPRLTIADTEVIKKKKILTEHEAILFINYFFEQLHPFYPFIPEEMHNSEWLAQMPILLVVILTISSRYCKFAEKGTKYFISSSRGSQIHSNLWDYCQQLISQTVWAEASTRSIGTVYSFLLISEWNPRAIHWRFNDYANSPRPIPDGGASAEDPPPRPPPSQQGASTSATPTPGGPQVRPQAFYPQKLPGDNGFDASKRSDRMSWLLIGTAIRLAQDMGLMDTDSNVYVAAHLSETVLALRLGRRPMLSASAHDEFLNLEFTPFQQAKLSILKIMSLAHETLYLSRKNTRELLQGGRFLAFLNLFGPHLNNWETVYRSLFDEPGLERESILFDFHYTRLYIYSLALSNKSAAVPDMSNGRPSGMLSDVLSATRYVGIATDAAREMLAIVARVYDMDKLRLAPIRWIVRAVHAAVFLVKTVLLTPPTSMHLHKATIAIIKKTAITLKDSSPDDVHLANRYSMILLNLCDDMTEKYHNAERGGGGTGHTTRGTGAHRKPSRPAPAPTSTSAQQGPPAPQHSAPPPPTVATAVASVVNAETQRAPAPSITDQRVPVLAVQGLVHPVHEAELQQRGFADSVGGGVGGLGQQQQQQQPFGLEEPSFGYSRYGQPLYTDQAGVDQDDDGSARATPAYMYDASGNGNGSGPNGGGDSLLTSYMQFGLGPVAGASSSEGFAASFDPTGSGSGVPTPSHSGASLGNAGGGVPATATALSGGAGLPEFNFDFWMDGHEGLGFVEQLVNSMEMQQHRVRLQRQEQEQGQK